jgi:ion channel POLLUX/CASTOR
VTETTLRDRARYAFDSYMARGVAALILALALASLAVIVVIALIITIADVGPGDAPGTGFGESLWLSLMRTLDSGTMGGDEGRGFRVAMLAVTLGGIFVISTLIGVLNNGISNKLEELRKGRSRAIESGHTVILGWSGLVFSIISELATANQNQRGACIVILGDKDKVEMEDEIRAKVGRTGRTRIVCRTGNPMDLADLAIASPHSARSIIVLAPEAEDPDSNVIKIMLAITNNPNRRPEPYHIVAAIEDAKNLEIARMVGGDEAELVLTSDLISRIVAQTCRQSGLSVVYNELLDFDGDEVYFHEEPQLAGRTFADATLAYESSAVIGIHRPGEPPRLNPPGETMLQAGDRLIVVAADDDTTKLSGAAPAVDRNAIQTGERAAAGPERTLVLGWNRRAAAIIHELDSYVPRGSTLLAVGEHPDEGAGFETLAEAQQNLELTHHSGDTTDRRTLDALDVPSFDHIIVLSYADELDPQQADARTLITLLHLRDIGERSGEDLSIVSEMLDIRNRALAEVTQADDFIVSDKITSLILAQVSENKHLNAVFTDLLGPEGSETYLKPASDYIALGKPVNFATVVAAASARGEVAFGYRLQAQSGDAANAYGVRINPPKGARVTYSEADRIIVLADQ